VSLSDPAAAAHLDQAPVTVNVTDRAVSGVLAVPVTALVAAAGGGYGVWLRSQGARRLVPVTPGLFSASLVQITAPGLATGDSVEVPSP
jgi:multidrug efflux pump subunit AcrA (membrane-fusion protein)